MTAANKELIEKYAAVLKEFEEYVQKNHPTLVISNMDRQDKRTLTTEPALQPNKKPPPS